jgi:Fe-Mn family superoxide dismutase
VILYLNPRDGSLANVWISSHEDGHPAGCVPLLVMDVWEHAYMVDRGASGRAEYIEAFFRNVDWAKVEERLRSWRKSS